MIFWGAIHFVAPQERQPYYNSTITEEERHFEMHPFFDEVENGK